MANKTIFDQNKVSLTEIRSTRVIPINEKKANLLRKMAEAAQPKIVLPMSQWAEKNVFFPSEATSQPGNYSNSTFPYWVPLMDNVITPGNSCKEIMVLKGHQIGYTTILVLATMYLGSEAPTPMMLLQATGESAKLFMSTKWSPFIKANRCMDAIYGDLLPQGYQNTILSHTFPGGYLMAGSAVNTDFVKGKSARVMCIDEESSYDMKTIDGSVIPTAKKRTSAFPDRLVIRGTTPQILGTCTLTADWPNGTQGKLYVPCPHCNPDASRFGNWLTLEHETFLQKGEIEDDLAEEVVVVCPHCAGEILEATKAWWWEPGNMRWMSTKNSENGEPYDMDWNAEVISIHLPAYYSPLGFLSWREAFQDYNKYIRTRDIADLQVYRNQIQGFAIDLSEQEEISQSDLIKRAEASTFGKGDIQAPKKCLMITTGSDVQKDRIETTVMGHGLDSEIFILDYRVFYGVTDTLGDNLGLSDGYPTAYRQYLEFVLLKKYRHESGCELPIEFNFIDAGYETNNVHSMCKAYEQRKIFPIVGRSGWNDGKLKTPKQRHKDYGTMLFIAMKEPNIFAMRAQMLVMEPGPRHIHFANNPRINKKYFAGLFVEQKKVVKRQGKSVITYENPEGGRNEPSDTFVYARCAFYVSGVTLSIRAARKYPLGESVLTFWKNIDEEETPEIRRVARENGLNHEMKDIFIPQTIRKKRKGWSSKNNRFS